MNRFRFTIGRAMIHIGLRVMPQSRARSELFQMFDLWSSHVRRAIKELERR